MLTVFLFNVNVDDAVDSVDVIWYKRGDEPRFVDSSRERNACKRYQCGLSSITFVSKKFQNLFNPLFIFSINTF
jgi:hypothetical protein